MANHFIENDPSNPEFRPLGAWAYFGLTLLYAIPILGWIFLIVFSLSDANINRRNFSRSYLCWFVILIILVVVGMLTGTINDFIQAAAKGTLNEYFSFIPWLPKA